METRHGRLRELCLLFLQLGATAFGGPAAHIALMREEVVRRRRWMDDRRFLDLLGATNLIPGPNSTEMAIHTGAVRAGWRGLLVAGASFILPAALIVLALAWAYVRWGATPAAEGLLYGLEPVVIAVVFHALVPLGRAATSDLWTAGVGVASIALYLAGANELAIMAGGGLVVGLVRNAGRLWAGRTSLLAWLWVVPLAQAARAAAELDRLFLLFLKVGAVLYGSGYVLLAFLRSDLVVERGWLTEGQLLDAISIGQVTPGPVFTTATFVGFVVESWWGAVVATVGIFVPSFVFVALSGPLIPRIRRSAWAGAFLDGVTVAALGLMAGVTWQLALRAVVDVPTGLIAAAAAGILFATRLNPVWPILAGAALGLAIRGI